MNIALTTADDDMFWIMVVEIQSILNYLDEKVDCIFHILTTNGFSPEKKHKLEELKEKNNCEFMYYEVEHLFENANVHTQDININIQTYYRLIIPEIVKAKKCLYLDTDIICCGSIEELYETDITDYMIAGVKAPGYVNSPNPSEYCQRNGLVSLSGYINTGVLLMNLENLRNSGFSQKAMVEMEKYHDSQDQDIINKLCYGKILELPFKYNLMTMQYERQLDDYGQMFDAFSINEAWSAPLLIHFAGRQKPWSDYKCIYADRWWASCLNSLINEKFVTAVGRKMLFSSVFSNSFDRIVDWKRRLWDRIRFEKKIYIYGAGLIGKRIALILESNELDFQGFVVTKTDKERSSWHGKPIMSFDSASKDNKEALYIIGVMDDKKNDIIENLINAGCYKFVVLNNGNLY